jgi:hypothetical protein
MTSAVSLTFGRAPSRPSIRQRQQSNAVRSALLGFWVCERERESHNPVCFMNAPGGCCEHHAEDLIEPLTGQENDP